MIKSITAYTYEVDDVELAVSEILGQLRLEGNLLKNSVGIIHCAAYFIDSGVVAALSRVLPFRVAGVTTLGCAVHDEISELALTIMVLTSNEVNFSIGLTEPITSRDLTVFQNAYDKAVETLAGKPALAISYFPLATAQFGAGGDFVVETMTQISDGVPVFGTMPVDNTHDFHEARILCDGNAYSDRFAFILLQGEHLKPRFYLAAVSDENIRQDRGVITDARGNLLYSVDNTPILDYLKNTLGLPFDETDPSSVHMIPLLMDFEDGAPPVVRAMNNFNAEHVAVCSGELKNGVTLLTGRFNKNIVLETTQNILEKIQKVEPHANGLLIYSCAARYWTLGLDSLAELEIIRDSLVNMKTPYLLGYSCGELCPVQTPNGSLTNRMHNYTFIVCVF